MAELKVFVSSTCYDLSLLRSQLRLFIKNMGYIPIMSEYEDILYDPRNHTHTSCIDEVKNCDVLVLIIGSRFGGKASLEALNKIDFELLKKESTNLDSLMDKDCLSVTQLEVLTAIENSIPVYTFIDKGVWYDHAFYEKNKEKNIIDEIIFPSIAKQETAKYIFNFINFIRFRTKNNNIFFFEKGNDIEDILKKQWSSYFQKLLREQRFMNHERKHIDLLSERFEDLKTAILSSINAGDQRDIARGIVNYRRLFDFLLSFRSFDLSYIKTTQDSWDDVLKRAKVVQIIPNTDLDPKYRVRGYMIQEDDTYYELIRISPEGIEALCFDWNAFTLISPNSRSIIADTLLELARPLPLFYYKKESFFTKFPQYAASHATYCDSTILESQIENKI